MEEAVGDDMIQIVWGRRGLVESILVFVPGVPVQALVPQCTQHGVAAYSKLTVILAKCPLMLKMAQFTPSFNAAVNSASCLPVTRMSSGASEQNQLVLEWYSSQMRLINYKFTFSSKNCYGWLIT